MVSTIEQGCLDVHQRVASEGTVLHCVLNTSVDRRDVFLRNTTTSDLVDKLVSGGLALFHLVSSRSVRLQSNNDAGELTRTTGLLLVGVLELLDRLADGLTVSNLRVTDVCFNLELALHAVNQDVEMELAHTADNGLAGFLIQVNSEGRILFSQTLNSGTQLLLVGLGLGLNSNVDNRIREGHGLQNNRSILCTQGVTGGGVL